MERPAKKPAAWALMIAIAGLACVLTACATSPSQVQLQNAKQKASIHRVRDGALSELYRAKPQVKKVVENAAGYAVFSDFGFRSMPMEDARAMGVAVNNSTGQETFMKMVQLQPNPTADGRKFRMILVFETEQALAAFTKSAWLLGPGVMAASIPDDRSGPLSGAIMLEQGMHAYQLDEHGVPVGFTIRDVMFYRDRELK